MIKEESAKLISQLLLSSSGIQQERAAEFNLIKVLPQYSFLQSKLYRNQSENHWNLDFNYSSLFSKNFGFKVGLIQKIDKESQKILSKQQDLYFNVAYSTIKKYLQIFTYECKVEDLLNQNQNITSNVSHQFNYEIEADKVQSSLAYEITSAKQRFWNADLKYKVKDQTQFIDYIGVKLFNDTDNQIQKSLLLGKDLPYNKKVQIGVNSKNIEMSFQGNIESNKFFEIQSKFEYNKSKTMKQNFNISVGYLWIIDF